MIRVWLDDWPRWRRRAGTGRRDLAPYNVQVTPSLKPASANFHRPVDLSVEEATRIADAINASHAESTRAVYGWA